MPESCPSPSAFRPPLFGVRLLASVLLLPLALAAQPQGTVLWSAEGNDGIYSTVAIPDVDGDSVPEAVGAIYYGGTPSDARKVYCCSGRTGDTLWVSRTAYGTWGNKGLDCAGDLNRDGCADVVLGTVGTYIPPGRCIVAINGLTGANLWVRSFPPPDTWGWVYSVRRYVDRNGDGAPEVLAGVGGTTNNPSGHAVLLDGSTGEILWRFRADGDGVQSVAPMADVNADSVPDVIVCAGGNSADNHVYCVSGATGTQLWSYLTGASVSDGERIRDVNHSGCDDVVAGGWDYCVHCIEGSTGAMIWRASMGSGNIVMEVVPVRDVNADGIDDVIVGAWDDYVKVLSGADGSVVWSGLVGADVWSVDTLADLTDDSVPEVVAGCLGNGAGVLKVFDGAAGTELWRYNFAERVYDVTGAPDMDGDGRADVLAGLQDHENLPDHFYCFSGLPASAVSESGAAGGGFAITPSLARHPALCLSAGRPTVWTAELFDAAGRELHSATGVTAATRTGIALPALGSGAFFVRVTLGDGRSAVTKLVVP
jgi:outer membrane protein assembly factor BamB